MADLLNNIVVDKPISPLGSQLLIKLNKVDDKTEGGLFVPTGASEKPKEGVVVAAGPGGTHPVTGTDVTNPYAPGDLVLFAEGAGERVDYNSEKHIFCESTDVYGKFTGDAASVGDFEPACDCVLVTITEAPEETVSGIALSLDVDERADNKGEVVAVGGGGLSVKGDALPMPVSVGDNVLYSKKAGTVTKIDGTAYKLVTSGDCLAKW